MEKINWINGQAGGTPLSAENLNQMQTNIEDAIDEVNTSLNTKITGTSLYEDSTGTKGTVTLSDSAANYNFLEIFFYNSSTGTNTHKFIKVFNPNNKNILLDFVDFNSSSLNFETRVMLISGTSISNVRRRHYTIADSESWTPYGSASDSIYITKVVGYNY